MLCIVLCWLCVYNISYYQIVFGLNSNQHQIQFTYDMIVLFTFDRTELKAEVPYRKLQYAKQFPAFIFES